MTPIVIRCPPGNGFAGVATIRYQFDSNFGSRPMAAIKVWQLDDDVVDRLKRCASSNNRSLEGEVRHILDRGHRDDF